MDRRENGGPVEKWQIVRRGKKVGGALQVSEVHARLQREISVSRTRGLLDHEAISKLVPDQRESAWHRESMQLLRTAVRGRAVDSLVCLGLGSFASLRIARYQMACAVLLQREYAVPAVVYDPVMVEQDGATARALGFRVGACADDFDSDGEGVLVFFMPHCHVSLYQTIIGIAIKHSFLSRIVFLGNGLRRQPEVMRKIAHRLDKWYIELVQSKLLEQEMCPDGEESVYATAFNDFAVCCFRGEQK